MPHISLVFREMWDTTNLDPGLPTFENSACGELWYPTSRETQARYGAPGILVVRTTLRMTLSPGRLHYRWRPATPAATRRARFQADILLFGGSAGSLKTETMLMDAVQEYENPNLRAIVFRSSFVEMTDIIDKTRRLYAPMGGVFVGSPKWTWSFPSGATIRFAYMKTDDDVWKYLGPRYSFIGFDESTLHTEKQVRNILGRLSATDPSLRLRMRLTSNPGNVGAAWHQSLFLRGHCPVHNRATRPNPANFTAIAAGPPMAKPFPSP